MRNDRFRIKSGLIFEDVEEILARPDLPELARDRFDHIYVLRDESVVAVNDGVGTGPESRLFQAGGQAKCRSPYKRTRIDNDAPAAIGVLGEIVEHPAFFAPEHSPRVIEILRGRRPEPGLAGQSVQSIALNGHHAMLCG